MRFKEKWQSSGARTQMTRVAIENTDIEIESSADGFETIFADGWLVSIRQNGHVEMIVGWEQSTKRLLGDCHVPFNKQGAGGAYYELYQSSTPEAYTYRKSGDRYSSRCKYNKTDHVVKIGLSEGFLVRPNQYRAPVIIDKITKRQWGIVGKGRGYNVALQEIGVDE